MITLELQWLQDVGKLLHYDQMLRCYTVIGSRREKITYIWSSKIHIRPCLGMVTLELQWLQDAGILLHYDRMLRSYTVAGSR